MERTMYSIKDEKLRAMLEKLFDTIDVALAQLALIERHIISKEKDKDA